MYLMCFSPCWFPRTSNFEFLPSVVKILCELVFFLRVSVTSMVIRALGGYLPPAQLLLSKDKLVNLKTFTKLDLG